MTGTTMAVFRRLVIAVVVSAAMLLTVISLDGGTRMSFSCMLCRLYHTETTLWSISRSTHHVNECSAWYRDHHVLFTV
jgi:hypothetical protein